MSIKNLGTYFCKIENINKNELRQYMDYLLNDDHDNHDTTEILGNSMDGVEIEEYLIRNEMKIKTNDENYKKGVKLKVSDKSLTLNIPPTYAASESHLKTIQKEMLTFINELYLDNTLDGSKDMSKDIFTNIHNQENQHINFTLPYLDNEGKTIRMIKSKRYFFQKIAKQFTKVVDKVLDKNIKEYKTQVEIDLIAILSDFSTSLIEYDPEEQKVIVEHFKDMEKDGNIEGIKSLVDKMVERVKFSDLMQEYQSKEVTTKTSSTNIKI
jgi:hypothetical protein